MDRSPSTYWQHPLIAALLSFIYSFGMFFNLVVLLHIVDVLPVKTATNERAFSTMNEVSIPTKTIYALRCIKHVFGLNGLILLYVHHGIYMYYD